jgi:PBP1b-binding outer membrane lipoprotein LpoB
MFGKRGRLAVAVAGVALVLSACTSSGKTGGPTSTSNGTPASTHSQTPTSTPKTTPATSVSQKPVAKEALGDVKLGAIRVDAKLKTPMADITITNHSAKSSNYIVDVSITSADGKTQIDNAVVHTQSLAPGHTADLAAHFRTNQKLPSGAKITIVGLARLVA